MNFFECEDKTGYNGQVFARKFFICETLISNPPPPPSGRRWLVPSHWRNLNNLYRLKYGGRLPLDLFCIICWICYVYDSSRNIADFLGLNKFLFSMPTFSHYSLNFGLTVKKSFKRSKEHSIFEDKLCIACFVCLYVASEPR